MANQKPDLSMTRLENWVWSMALAILQRRKEAKKGSR